MNLERIAAPPANDPAALLPLDLTCVEHSMSPTVMEMIGNLLLQSAARLRAIGYTGGEGRA